MIVSLILFVLFVIIYLMISDIITVFFRLTGMTEEKARFQVISLLTNSGFTTRESEAVVASKTRRRIARATMIFGYAFTVTIVTTTVNFFMTIEKSELKSFLIIFPILLAAIVIFQIFRHSAFFKTKFDRWIEKIGARLMFGKNSNSVILVEDYGETVIAHIYLHSVPLILKDTRLKDSVLKSQYNIMVMTVKSKNSEAVQASADTVLKPDDIIMVMGNRKDIKNIFMKTA